jgi:hypothetical protein
MQPARPGIQLTAGAREYPVALEKPTDLVASCRMTRFVGIDTAGSKQRNDQRMESI